MTAIQYQGRKTRRAGSEQRRQAILEAALTIIVREGIRSVRHRAVAKEADVPLSATTYYFKDISDLIADAFTLFAERAMADVIEPFRQQAFALMESFSADDLKDPAQLERLLKGLSEMTAGFIINEVTQRRGHLIAEQAFLQEAVLDKRLSDLADLYLRQQMMLLEGACTLLGSEHPRMDAELILSTMMTLEQRLLVHPENALMEFVQPRMHNLFSKLLAHAHG
ncbi:TetR family transcriptional regulator [Alcanivorax hongdengensis A-11-3]|uniref:TetR family transcriptional regulator n=1 Tax=Alcanivorax hongdengensis A-11-3 TaxID=1177179 RepID=L0WAH4_9GAMM|nr:TetR family transcriptional regulator [Alcanivorax hongdengensis]EKF73951.1 TetR family transcriptional regulator [Alcanivorax hongdengensis A-11-3]